MTVSNSNYTGSHFQIETFFALSSKDDNTLKSALSGMSWELMLILMSVLQEGKATADQKAQLAKAGIGANKLDKLIGDFKSYMSTWTASSSEVEQWIAQMGLDHLPKDQLAMIADMFKDGRIDVDELNKMSTAGIINAEQFDGIREAFEWAKNPGTPLASLSLEAVGALFQGADKIFGLGDWVLLLFMLVAKTSEDRLKNQTSVIADRQLALKIAQKEYSDHLKNQPSDPKSDAYAAWSSRKEDLKLSMDQLDTEVQELTAELKRMLDKRDMLLKLLQGMIEQVGQKEKELAGSIGK